MNHIPRTTLLLLAGGVLAALMVQPAEAAAWSVTFGSSSYAAKHDDHHRGYSDHHRDGWYRGGRRYPWPAPVYRPRRYSLGEVVFGLPAGYVRLAVGGKLYCYHDGYYFRKHRQGYIVVPAPAGARVSVLPLDYRIIHIGEDVYFEADGVYYKQAAQGYTVVPAPVLVAGPSAADVAAAEGQITIHVPNKTGGYTPVTLTPHDGGYVGPQGEFYPEFPKVAQLKTIYGR